MRTLIFVAAALLLSACGNSLSGTYADKQGMVTMTFGSGSKVIMSLPLFGKVEMKYEIEGNNLKLISPQGTQVYTILKDGSIEGPMGGRLVKRAQ